MIPQPEDGGAVAHADQTSHAPSSTVNLRSEIDADDDWDAAREATHYAARTALRDLLVDGADLPTVLRVYLDTSPNDIFTHPDAATALAEAIDTFNATIATRVP